MGRRIRHHLPGIPFHVTARLQGRADWFSEIEPAVASRILDAPKRSDAGLLAYAVMPNHLHLILVQGKQPLSQLMQPLLRRLALLVHRRTGREGHIFERRFRTAPCLDADYLRSAITYVHLNGLRAGLCSNIDEYQWCSHPAYKASGEQALLKKEIAVEKALRLFAAREGASLDDCRANYRRFVAWRITADAQRAAEADGLESVVGPERPITAGGDTWWAANYAPVPFEQPPARPHRSDLLDIAKATLLDLAPDMDLETLRSGSRTRAVVPVRHRVILRALAAGHRGGVIARFLGITPATVSSVRTAAMHDGR